MKKLFREGARPIQVKKTEYKEKVVIRLEFSHEESQKLERLKALKSHKPNPEDLFLEWIEKELKAYEETSFKTLKSKSPRQISTRLRNHALKRAQYRCQHPGCVATHFLQIDHVVPVRAGGLAKAENLQVLCSAHNRLKG